MLAAVAEPVAVSRQQQRVVVVQAEVVVDPDHVRFRGGPDAQLASHLLPERLAEKTPAAGVHAPAVVRHRLPAVYVGKIRAARDRAEQILEVQLIGDALFPQTADKRRHRGRPALGVFGRVRHVIPVRAERHVKHDGPRAGLTAEVQQLVKAQMCESRIGVRLHGQIVPKDVFGGLGFSVLHCVIPPLRCAPGASRARRGQQI